IEDVTEEAVEDTVISGDTPEPPGDEEKAARYENLGRGEAPAAADEEPAAEEASEAVTTEDGEEGKS
ncbi:MAG TPA: hypothetical protein VKO35_06825, partial [Acidimicrobiia bacterium]|nr:hypothetical protein [Acidimicrobiia bacterium]